MVDKHWGSAHPGKRLGEQKCLPKALILQKKPRAGQGGGSWDESQLLLGQAAPETK